MNRDLPKLNVILVKPSKYDDDGYVIHHVRGVLPSNTLNALNGLFRDAAQKMGITIEMHLIDETVQLVVPEKVMRKWAIPGVPTLVGLVGVQTNQFPRAVDLARRFKKTRHDGDYRRVPRERFAGTVGTDTRAAATA